MCYNLNNLNFYPNGVIIMLSQKLQTVVELEEFIKQANSITSKENISQFVDFISTTSNLLVCEMVW